jgi:hypothetical protein
MPFQFVGGSYALAVRTADVQRAVNLYPALVESTSGKAPAILESIPGLSLFATLGMEVRGIKQAAGRVFVVAGSTLYELASDGTATSRGTLSTSSGPVDMASRQRAQETSADVLTDNIKAIGPGILRGFNRGVGTLSHLLGKVLPDTPQYAEQRKKFDQFNAGLDDENKDKPGYKAGDFAGKVLVTSPVGGVAAAPLRAVPALAPLADSVATAGFRAGGAKGIANLLTRSAGGAVNGSASAALIDPKDALGGALIGGGLPLGLAGLGVGMNAVGNLLRPGGANSDLTRTAINQYGIPLGAADISTNPLIKGARSVLNDVPVIGGIGTRQKQAVQEGFNQAVGSTFGANAKSLTPQVMDAAKKNLGSEFDRIWNNNALPYDGQLFNDIQGLRANADKLPNGEGARLKSWLDDVESKMQPDSQGNLPMPGDVANRMQSKLRQEAENANGFLALHCSECCELHPQVRHKRIEPVLHR